MFKLIDKKKPTQFYPKKSFPYLDLWNSICLCLQVYQWLDQVVIMPSDSLTIATRPGRHPQVTAGCHARDPPSLWVVKDSLILHQLPLPATVSYSPEINILFWEEMSSLKLKRNKMEKPLIWHILICNFNPFIPPLPTSAQNILLCSRSTLI